MKLDELKSKISEQDGLRVCIVCGLPYKPYRGNQKTCADPLCQKLYHRQYVKDYNRKRRAENPEVVREYNRLKMRQYRQRQREIEERDRQLEELSERWQKQIELDKKIADYGHEYGKRSAEKVLATVPKIDVNLKGKDNDDTHDQDYGK